MGHLAFEHTVTITDLRSRIAELQTEFCSWVRRSSQDATAAMILAEENVVLARANSELLEHMAKLNSRQRKQTELLGGLLVNSDYVCHPVCSKKFCRTDRHYSNSMSLTCREFIPGLSEESEDPSLTSRILAPTTLATRHDLVSSIERQLTRPLTGTGNQSRKCVSQRRSDSRPRGSATWQYSICRRVHTQKGYGNDIQLRAVRLAEESPTTPQDPASDCVRKIERAIDRPAKQGGYSLLRPFLRRQRKPGARYASGP